MGYIVQMTHRESNDQIYVASEYTGATLEDGIEAGNMETFTTKSLDEARKHPFPNEAVARAVMTDLLWGTQNIDYELIEVPETGLPGLRRCSGGAA